MARHVVKLGVTLVVLVLQLNYSQPSRAGSQNYVMMLGNHGPTPLGSASLCSMPNGSRIGKLDALALVSPGYLHDYEEVPGYGTLSDNINYVQNVAPNTTFTTWGYDIVGGYTVPANTPITVYTLAFTDSSFSTAFYITKLVFDCTTGAVLSLYNGPINTTTTTSCSVGSDGRVDANCAERVAVYCNTSANPPTLDVWGIGRDSQGIHLTTFVFADIVKVGPTGLTRSLGKLGTVSVMVDVTNHFWLAWNGQVTVPSGSFYADGQPGEGFAKGFACNFAR